jgi:hypothetical protein
MSRVYFWVALTVIAYGFYWFCDRVIRMRRARRGLKNLKRWHQELSRAYELEEEAEQQILGV